jgi:hypothetical protein
MVNPHAEAARAEVLGRLLAYRASHAALYANVRRAAELGISITVIAQSTGLSWHGVKKILDRTPPETGV